MVEGLKKNELPIPFDRLRSSDEDGSGGLSVAELETLSPDDLGYVFKHGIDPSDSSAMERARQIYGELSPNSRISVFGGLRSDVSGSMNPFLKLLAERDATRFVDDMAASIDARTSSKGLSAYLQLKDLKITAPELYQNIIDDLSTRYPAQFTFVQEFTPIIANEINARNSIYQLPSSSEYQGQQTEVLGMREASIIEPENGIDGLYTFGAGPCAVMIIVVRDQNGSPARIGMAHIDALTDQGSIAGFMYRMTKDLTSPNYQPELSIISGEPGTVQKILDMAKPQHLVIKMCAADFSGSDNDAVVVDSNGRIYYGMRQDLNSGIDMNQLDAVGMSLITGLPQPLSYKSH